MFKDALSKAISENGTLSQRLSVLNGEQKIKLYKSLVMFMTPEHGFYQATGDMQSRIRPYSETKTVVFDLKKEFGKELVVFFEMFKSPRTYHYQKSHDDGVFTDEVLQIHGSMRFTKETLFCFGECGYLPSQEIQYEFYFTDKFVKIIESKLKE